MTFTNARECAHPHTREDPTMSTITRSATHTTITTVNTNTTPNTHVPSIRSIIRGGILRGVSKAEMKSAVDLHHPMSAASTKFAKHLAWYRADMKKKNELPEQNEVEETEGAE